MNLNREEQRVIHTFISKFAATNITGQFSFSFREPIRNIIGGRVKSVIIKTFGAINNSATYYLRTDSIFGLRDTSCLNAKPDLVAMVIPNRVNIAGQPLYHTDDSDGFYHSYPRYLNNAWFELLDDNLVVINPADVGWYFVVEIEFLIKPNL